MLDMQWRESAETVDSPAPTCRDSYDLIGLLAQLSLSPRDDALCQFLELRFVQGVSAEELILDYLQPVARHLGSMWDDDDCDFAAVTLGMCRLHKALRQFSLRFLDGAASMRPGRSILLAVTPGEQHILGLSIVAEFFRRDGWDVALESVANRGELIRRVRRESFAVIGLSVGAGTMIAALAQDIAAVRRESRNRNIQVLIGGPAVVADPRVVGRVDADMAAPDAPGAVEAAGRLVELTSDMS